MMAEGDLASALRRLMERGWQSGDATRPDMAGLQDLMDRLRQRRQELRERFGLDDVLGDIRRELGEIVEQERAGVQERLDRAATDAPSPDLGEMLRDAAAKRLDQLDALPDDVGERIRDLRDYDFMESAARERFDALVERLTAQVLDQFVQGMGEAIRSTTPEDLDANREMVRDLNELIRQRIGGVEPDVATSWPSTAASSRARPRSTTSWTSSPSAWPPCSRSCARCRRSSGPSSSR